jgi:hypothetical protein
MQTFLPYKNFERSARVLDYRRLGKQRVEVLQILQALERESGGWVNHPATRIWRGYTNALVAYGLLICREWQTRGYKDTCDYKIAKYWQPLQQVVLPPLLGREDFHASHRSNLLRKNFEHYSQFGWRESDDLPYVWE